MRIVSWNVENLAAHLPELPAACAALGDPDMLCLQELRIRAHDTELVAALERALPGYQCHHALPRDPHNVRYRGGRAYGVATFVRGEARGAVPGFDREGRVVVVRHAGLAIANVYAVNGTARPYLDEHGREAGDRHAFKRRFQRAVLELGRALAGDGGVVLAGDWNVSRAALDTHPRLRTEEPHATARAELNALLDETGFVDIWRARHPDERGYTWFNPRSRTLDAARVDYLLVSADLVERVRAAHILARHPWSDHAPIDLELAV
ncbi:MAG TPA: exodeoxyribonuclease III [Kofleriaceae bacterium]|nr:exodeoxyribonuclease III [Kofleriaceae bacterium]